ncbi:MAG: ATP-binding cassette domain-containing protein [Chthoniobacterales bacterium]
MPLFQLRNIALSYGGAPILDGVDLQIDPGERVCLLGRNGAGKTSLLRVIAGEEAPASGEIIRPPATVLTRLQQEVPRGLEGEVIDVLRSGLSPDRHEEEWESDVRLENLAETMNLPAYASFADLSGGLKRRVLLGRSLAAQPDVLLLDEPTNHLDLDSILWLENFLLETRPTLLFVTHDRAFLRRLATRIIELDRGRLTSWACSYETFLERKAAALEAEQRQWATFDKKLAQEEAWIRQGVKARRTRDEGRVRALKELRRERSQRREREGTATLALASGATSGQKVIEVKDASFSFGEKPIVQNLNTTIWRGDKIGIIGPNGSGKTTLLQLLLGRLEPTSGEVRTGTNLDVVYLDQLRAQIDNSRTVAQNVAGDAETVTFDGRPRNIHSYLQDFLFRSDRIRLPASALSGGERNRLLLARLFLQPANLLVLDEPTNDLDAETLELLEELLLNYSGTLLLVSHDRDFLDHVVTSTLVFEGEGEVNEYVGGYVDWLAQRARKVEKPATAPEPERSDSTPAPGQKSERAPKFLNRERKELAELPDQIETLEREHADVTERLASPDLYRDEPSTIPRLQARVAEIERETTTAFARWDELEARRQACEE